MMTAIRHDNHAKDLQILFEGIADSAHIPQLLIDGLALDSRQVKPGYLFLACAGTQRHGLHFIEQALANGAVAVALEPTAETAGVDLDHFNVPVFWVERLHWVASEVAGRFYDHPSESLKVVGITGTNGKTSISHFIAQSIGGDTPCGLVGTLGSGLYGQLGETAHTTPDAVTLQRQLAEMCDAGAGYVVMEVSSHALDQGRVNGIQFDVAVFTNLSHEHLDYHRDMLSYAAAKYRLLEMPGLRQAVINADDAVGREWLASIPAGLEGSSYAVAGGEGASLEVSLFADALKLDATGLAMEVVAGEQRGVLKTGLLGRFNASNLLAALGALCALGYEFNDALSRLAGVSTVPGRMEAFGGSDKPLVVVDYAHTPDALEHVLSALREHTSGQLWCIFGCGGERDREKRPMMGKIAEQSADNVVITDDNPRRENPFSIIEDIISGIENPDAVYINRNRAKAIAHAINLSHEGDVILVAGKGHETEQQIEGQTIPYSDRDTVASLLGEEVHGG